MRALVVIPTYNEAGNISEVLRRVRTAAPDAEVLVVDDGSPDGTADLAEVVGREVGGVHVLRRAAKAGLGDSYSAGFGWALDRDVPIVVEMDADLQHDPAVVPALLAAIDDGADLVIGSRYIEGGSIPDWRWHRRLLSRGGNRYAASVLSLGLRDATSGFRAYRRDLLRRIDLDAVYANGYGFQIEMAYLSVRGGATVVEIPIRFVARRVGESKMSGTIVVEALLLVTWWAVRDRLFRRGR